MPTYEYRCTECGESLEAVQRFTDEPLTVCPVCGGRLRKLFSQVGVVFKGSGFYKTDSRPASGGRSKDKKDEPAKVDAGGSAEKKSEAAELRGDKAAAKKADPSDKPASAPAPKKSTSGGDAAVA